MLTQTPRHRGREGKVDDVCMGQANAGSSNNRAFLGEQAPGIRLLGMREKNSQAGVSKV